MLLSDIDVRAVLNPADLVDPIAQLYEPASAAAQVTPARLNIHHDSAYLRLMPSILPQEGLMGFKVFHRGTDSGVRYLVVVCDLASGEIIGLVDSNYLTAARTGANSGVAARYLAPGASSVGIIGSGLEAETNLQAIARVAGVGSVKVFSPNRDRREAFAKRMSVDSGYQVQAVDDPESAVQDVDLVLVATNTGLRGPTVYRAGWLQPGQCLISVGSTSLTLRELEGGTFERANIIVVDASSEQVASESADVVDFVATASGRAYWDDHVCQLASLVDGTSARPSGSQTSLFKSVGAAGQDLVAARIACETAKARGLGTDAGELTVEKFFQAK